MSGSFQGLSWSLAAMAMQMQLEASADTSAEEESLGPQLISRLEVGEELPLEEVLAQFLFASFCRCTRCSFS